MSRILVTGAAGFIGSHVCDALLGRGDSVVGLDCFDDFYDPAAKRRNLAACARHPAFSLIEADIRDPAAVDRALAGVDAVIHLAARAGVRPSIHQPLLFQDVNVGGTCVLLEAARCRGLRRFVFASSSSVYGNNRKVPFAETDPVDFPISPYAATKRAGELIAHTYAHLHGLDVTCLRLFTVYGPRQRPDLAIHKFARLIEAGEPIPIYGNLDSSRDYTFVADIVDGLLRALDRCGGFRIYNLGNSHPIPLAELVSTLEKALAKPARIDHQPAQPGDVQRTFADLTAARRDLGYAPATSLESGLGQFVRWLRSPGS